MKYFSFILILLAFGCADNKSPGESIVIVKRTPTQYHLALTYKYLTDPDWVACF